MNKSDIKKAIKLAINDLKLMAEAIKEGYLYENRDDKKAVLKTSEALTNFKNNLLKDCKKWNLKGEASRIKKWFKIINKERKRSITPPPVGEVVEIVGK